MKFNDQIYIDRYVMTGKLPDIHNDIMVILAGEAWPVAYAPIQTAIDIGSCTGLLSVALRLKCGFTTVVGVERAKGDYQRAVTYPGVIYYNTTIEDDLTPLAYILREHRPELAVCRRVLPEIEETCDGLVQRLGSTLASYGVRYIALEGRVPTKRHSAKLWNADLEVDALGDSWHVVDSYKNCRLLEWKP